MTDSAAKGSWLDKLLYLALALVMALAGFAIFKGMTDQQSGSKLFAGWKIDKAGYEAAMARQKETGEPVLVYFFADWCPYCKNFNKNVLSSGKVSAFLSRYEKVRVSPDSGEAEKALMREFGADGFPSLYLVKPGQQPERVEIHRGDDLKSTAEFIETVETMAGPRLAVPAAYENTASGNAAD